MLQFRSIIKFGDKTFSDTRSITRNIKRLLSHIIDVHTHMYTPKYMEILSKRTKVPMVARINDKNRLIILPDEEKDTTTNRGRPIGREYWDISAKLQYMDTHNITHSVISLANPWLDFLYGEEAENVAKELNDELQNICSSSNGRIFGFAALPVRNQSACLKEIERLKQFPNIKGVILGTPGAGNGLDHENMRDILHAIEKNNYTIFLHPHYGVGNEHYYDSGHALFLALGFPFETTVSISRLIVSGTLDKLPNLKILVAHAGAALPSLIGRLDSCVAHDIAISNRLQHEPSTYLKRLYFDAISYGTPQLKSLIEQVGEDRIMFGTDNPFFPPLGVSEDDVITASWPSTNKVIDTIHELSDKTTQQKIFSKNAKLILNL
eukprot:gene9329-12571_t